MGETKYDFIAINRLSYEAEINSAIEALEDDRYPDAKNILKDVLLALRKEDPCVKQKQEIGT